jgi:hypothetical protein
MSLNKRCRFDTFVLLTIFVYFRLLKMQKLVNPYEWVGLPGIQHWMQ